ncbi:hypothetical protein [Polynucleobacter sphagniphilus]|uniref:hypothetical protein n=1 Tax=Polynucleobacter sphagniphilus TaxID=1743169 RepID=UPI002475DB14|nr:hypothetical protein [Polynucleobacter sphagniphilus]MDH6299943.1 hypothetical protein [Polynucleobacter sphagniphilus]
MRLQKRLGEKSDGLQNSLPLAKIQCHQAEGCAHPQCQRLIASYAGFYEQYCRTPRDDSKSSQKKLTLHAIALNDYSEAFSYMEKVSRRSSFFSRDVKKAYKNGFWVAPFVHSQKADEMDDIRGSVRMRSFGPVMQGSLFKKFPSKDEAHTDKSAADTISCPLHWELLFGVFDGPQSDIDQSRLVGFARLHRIGNIASYDELIGHGQYLHRGIMKLLHTHIVQWLVDAPDPATQGIEYLAHGSVERGNEGFFFWKKKALFMPHLVELVDFQLPDDFDEELYLTLNPDVLKSHIPPKTHYKIHGKLEGRAYK